MVSTVELCFALSCVALSTKTCCSTFTRSTTSVHSTQNLNLNKPFAPDLVFLGVLVQRRQWRIGRRSGQTLSTVTNILHSQSSSSPLCKYSSAGGSKYKYHCHLQLICVNPSFAASAFSSSLFSSASALMLGIVSHLKRSSSSPSSPETSSSSSDLLWASLHRDWPFWFLHSEAPRSDQPDPVHGAQHLCGSLCRPSYNPRTHQVRV